MPYHQTPFACVCLIPSWTSALNIVTVLPIGINACRKLCCMLYICNYAMLQTSPYRRPKNERPAYVCMKKMSVCVSLFDACRVSLLQYWYTNRDTHTYSIYYTRTIWISKLNVIWFVICLHRRSTTMIMRKAAEVTDVFSICREALPNTNLL